ncbi:hypothetical protein Tco_0080002 [Tanacetum coccineum]
MLWPAKKEEGAVLKRPSDTQPPPSFLTQVKTQLSQPRSLNLLRLFFLLTQFQNSFQKALVGNRRDLKSQIKQLKKKAKPVISHHNAWIKSVSMKKRLARKKSLKKKLMQKESVSKQGRQPAKSKPTMHKDPAFDDFDDIVDDAIDYMETEDAQDEGRTSSKTLELSLSRDTVVLEEKESEEKGVSIKDLVSTAQPKVSTNKPKVSADKDDEGTAELKIEFSDERATPTMTSTPTLLFLVIDEYYCNKFSHHNESEQRLIQEAQGNKKIEEEDELIIKSEDITLKLKEIQEEEREKFIIEQRAKFLHDTIAAQRIFLAQQRSEAIRNKLPTRNQLRNQMMTYLKHVKENKKALVMDKREEVWLKTLESSKVEGPKENIKKRSERILKMKAPKRSKRQKTDSDHEEENQLRIFLKKVPEEEEKIDYEILGTRTIVIESKKDDERLDESKKRRYPLTKTHTLERKMDLRLTTVFDDDTVFDLLRFIMQQIDEFEGQDGSEKDLECWFRNYTTNGHQFTMFNKHKNWLVHSINAYEKYSSNPFKDQTVPGRRTNQILLIAE